jgi:hypothetical protein
MNTLSLYPKGANVSPNWLLLEAQSFMLHGYPICLKKRAASVVAWSIIFVS